jgi:hypothetical protein
MNGANTDAITITCTGWKNPIYQGTVTGFTVIVKDSHQHYIETSAEFSLDTSSYSPYPIPSTDISLTLATSLTRESGLYTLSFTAPVPMVSADTTNTFNLVGGCYIKITMPREYTSMTTLAVTGINHFATPAIQT